MTNFVIAALPRSGTAWLTTALNTICSGMYVEHEGFGKAQRDGTPIAFNGSIGSDVIVPSVRNTIPDGWKHYYIIRPMNEVEASLKRIGIFNQDAWEASFGFAIRYINKFSPEFVMYEDLPDLAIDIARDMGHSIGPLEIAKLKQLCEMRVASRLYGEGR